MKSLLAVFLMLCATARAFATSYAAYDAPQLGYVEAIERAKQLFAKTEPDADKYYVFRAECGFHDLSDRRMWLVGFAKPQGWYGFVAVYMNGEARIFTSEDAKRLYDTTYTTPEQDGFRFTKPVAQKQKKIRQK